MSIGADAPYRNLGIDGGHELCGEMYNKGIMPHLVVLMGKVRGARLCLRLCLSPPPLPPKPESAPSKNFFWNASPPSSHIRDRNHS